MLIRILLIAFGVGVAGSVAQGPEFVQQYMQRLGGRLDELSRFVQRFEEDARRSSMTQQKAIETFTNSGSPFLERRGQDAVVTIKRREEYVAHKAALEEAGPFARLTVFAANYDSDIATATARDYRPAIPATAEGFLLAAAGFFVGYGLGELLLRLFGWGMRRTFARS